MEDAVAKPLTKRCVSVVFTVKSGQAVLTSSSITLFKVFDFENEIDEGIPRWRGRSSHRCALALIILNEPVHLVIGGARSALSRRSDRTVRRCDLKSPRKLLRHLI